MSLNEERNLPRLLATVPKGIEIVVLDSHSQDQTVKIAEQFGAKVYTRHFDDYASQKNHAFSLATRKWIFSLDADEVPSKDLWNEVIEICAQETETTAYRVRRFQNFLSKRLRFGKSGDSPIRVFPRNQAHYVGEIHEVLKLNQGISVKNTKNSLEHFSYLDIDDYFLRFNRYTSLMSKRNFRERRKPLPRLLICMRFFGEFFWRYILKLGFLDGYAGFVYSLYGSLYVFTKFAKLDLLYVNDKKDCGSSS
ncbi:MAG: glycosyltransferase family 2 protein [Proteobacteria bacterium]|nr:glycosyltransferase family 2 protein [Pseudomonadota bacterium]